MAGRNLANVNNPEYARQNLVTRSGGVIRTRFGTQSMGMEIVGVSHLRDAILDMHIVRETMVLGSLEAQNRINSWIESALGEQISRSSDTAIIDASGDGGQSSSGISKSLDDFFNSFHEIASSATEPSQRRVLLQNAQILVDRIHVVNDRLENLDSDIVGQINTDAGRASDLLEKIRNLNEQITRFELGSPGSAMDLRDQRQSALEYLAKLVNFEVRTTKHQSESNPGCGPGWRRG